MIFSLLHYSYKQNIIVGILLFYQLAFLAKTATAIGVFGIAVMIFGLIQVLKFRLKYVFLLISFFIIAGVSFTYIQKSLEDSRLGEIVNNVIDDPLQLAMVDQSAGVRLTSSFAPFLVIRHNYWMPVGLGNYNTFLRKLYHQRKYRKLITPFILKEKAKIGGCINLAMFQLGFLGMLLPIAIFLAFKKLFNQEALLLCFILFILLLFTQIQLMHSMIGLIIASAIFKSNQNDQSRLTSL